MGVGGGASAAGGFASADGRSTDGTNRVAEPAAGFWKERTTGAPGGEGAEGGGAAFGATCVVGGGAGSAAAPMGFPHATQVLALGSL
jgi:hypothetical protein